MNNQLFYYRKLRGMRQFELANEVGLKELTISNYETERATPSKKIALKIAKVLKVDVEEIFPKLIRKE